MGPVHKLGSDGGVGGSATGGSSVAGGGGGFTAGGVDGVGPFGLVGAGELGALAWSTDDRSGNPGTSVEANIASRLI